MLVMVSLTLSATHHHINSGINKNANFKTEVWSRRYSSEWCNEGGYIAVTKCERQVERRASLGHGNKKHFAVDTILEDGN
jgi:hypothetical protein